MLFEILRGDLAARIGRISTRHGIVETPAYVPVIHPVKQTIPAHEISEMGFDLVITNAYITMKSYGQEAVHRGIHNIIKYDGAIMTDSGGYQVLEYGKVDVTPPDMAAFERGIRTDFAIPLDRPTGLGMSYKQAESYVRHTLRVSKETLGRHGGDDSSQIWVGPIQGSEHPKLVTRSTKSLTRMGYKMLALGSPVEFMESYEYRLLAEMIITAKRHIPHSVPLHLFGAGHTLTIPLAVALGCDTFDSASYILYARQNRYISEDGTRRLDELEYFPCCCPACNKYTPAEMLQADLEERTRQLALHNLYAIKLEVDKTKQSIHEGRLWEYLLKKARTHPKLYEAITSIITTDDVRDAFHTGTAQFKQKAVFLYGHEDQYRPEVAAYHRTARRFRAKGKSIVVVTPETKSKPAYLSREYREAYRHDYDGDGDDNVDNSSIQFCQYNPVLGIIPIEISDLYPAAHHVTAVRPYNPELHVEFAETWDRFFANNNFEEVRYYKNDEFIGHFVERLDGIRKQYLPDK